MKAPAIRGFSIEESHHQKRNPFITEGQHKQNLKATSERQENQVKRNNSSRRQYSSRMRQDKFSLTYRISKNQMGNRKKLYRNKEWSRSEKSLCLLRQNLAKRFTIR